MTFLMLQSLVVVAILYFLFGGLLQVPLPMGLWYE